MNSILEKLFWVSKNVGTGHTTIKYRRSTDDPENESPLSVLKNRDQTLKFCCQKEANDYEALRKHLSKDEPISQHQYINQILANLINHRTVYKNAFTFKVFTITLCRIAIPCCFRKRLKRYSAEYR